MMIYNKIYIYEVCIKDLIIYTNIQVICEIFTNNITNVVEFVLYDAFGFDNSTNMISKAIAKYDFPYNIIISNSIVTNINLFLIY